MEGKEFGGPSPEEMGINSSLKKEGEQDMEQQEKGFISSAVEEVKKRLELRREWKGIEQLAKDNGFDLNLVSDKEYHKRSRPMPRGGALYIFGGKLNVRYEIVSPEEVRDFIEKQKTPDSQR